MSRVVFAIKLKAILLLILAYLPGIACAVDKQTDYENLSKIMSAQSKSQVRVIVTLNNTLPQGFDASISGSIFATQSLVLSDLAAGTFSDIKMYSHLPMMALKVSHSALNKLYNNKQVIRIYQDRLDKPIQSNKVEPPQLFDSVDVIQASGLWGLGHTGQNQAVAVLDTGVRTTHEMFSGKILAQACFSTNDPPFAGSACPNGASSQTGPGAASPPTHLNGYFHGTHVAGIAVGDRKTGGTFGDGVAPGANLIAINVFSQINDAFTCDFAAPCLLSYISDQIRALDYVYGLRNNYNIAAINMSVGGGRFSSHCDSIDSRTTIVNKLYNAGIVVVAASGNNGYSDSISSPACISNVVAVGSTWIDASFVSAFSNSAAILDLLAPGEMIESAGAAGDTQYIKLSGTSMAAPHVAGGFALIKSAVPGRSNVEIENALKTWGLAMTDSRNGVTRSFIKLLDTYNNLVPQLPQPQTGNIIPPLLLLLLDH